ncbi:MAG: neutral/alkaline non-lysosomal ceramidase N-terminal domain-containing protein [Planctomycetia bacterium]
MNALRSVVLLGLVILIGHSRSALGQESSMFLAGVASVEITPEFAVRLNGFGGRTLESQGVRQAIFAKALAVGTSEQDTVVILTVDTLGVPDDLRTRVAEQLSQKIGLSAERLAICASHTHSAPMIVNCANTLFGKPIPQDQWQHIVSYTELLESKLITVAQDAWNNRKPARVSWGIGRVKFAVNRRTAGGPVDHDLPVLAVHDLQGSLQSVLTNYACHCVTLSDDLISGDWAGYAMEHIQRLNPGCEALISIGCGADSNPRGGVLGGRAEVADSLGLELAQEVTSVLKSGLTPLTSAPKSVLERVTLPLAPLPSRAQWETQSKQENAAGYYAQVQLQRLDRGEPLMTEISYPIQSVHFGDQLALVFLPGEVVVDYSLRLKKELNSERLWINAYANACPGYVPSERILKEGGYEGGGAMVYYDIPGPYASGVEKIIVDTVHQQLGNVIPVVADNASRYTGEGTNGIAPLSPRRAVQSLQTSAGFRAELVVAEPLIQSPVAISFGPDGTLWVAEMTDYPQAAASEETESESIDRGADAPGSFGQIRRLTDSDHDGQPDHATVFLDGIPFPTGVTVWRDGILVCAAPDILFARDADGDGKAEHVEKLFTGFATHNYQARVNSLEYGLDGWLYGSCGLFGGQITSVKTGAVISLGQRDFRCNPDTGAFEPAAGATQQGRIRNDWGDWFGCNNSVPLMHYPLEDHYLRRNPFQTVPNNSVHLQAEPDRGRLYPVSSQVLFALSGPPNHATAACGAGIYRDSLFGAQSTGNAFTCEPVNNLVHRQQLQPNGSTFRSLRAATEQQQEFLASTDPWFRPVQARTGPDGALWVVDMYRYVIEHPIWIPPATLATLDTRAGANLGRIYRVAATSEPLRRMPDLTQFHGLQLAALMNTPNGIQRDLVQQLILWSNDRDAISGLRELCLNETIPAVRIQAASTWACLETLPTDIVTALLTNDDAQVRRHAVRLSEPLLQDSPEVVRLLTNLKDDPSPQVRLQLACSIGGAQSQAAAEVLAHLVSSETADVFLNEAADSSLTSQNAAAVFERLLQSAPEQADSRRLPLLASLADPTSASEVLAGLLKQASDSPEQKTMQRVTAFLEGLERRTDDFINSGKLRDVPQMDSLLALAQKTASSENEPVKNRVSAVQLLSIGQRFGSRTSDAMIELLVPQSPPAVQMAVVEALSRISNPEIAESLISDWAGKSPEVRRALLAAFLQRPEWTMSLLSSVQQGIIHRSELSLIQQQQLLNHPSEEVRAAATLCLQQMPTTNRQEVIDRFAAAVSGDGHPEAGLAAFRKHCATCHQLRNLGAAVGPDISNYAGKPVLAFLSSIIDPNQAVDPRYLSYVVVLRDGRTLTGLITAESDNGLTVLGPDGKSQTLLRTEIEQLRSTGKSLMPEGLDQNITATEMNDLWAWLKTQRQPPKTADGNHPAVIHVPTSGNVILSASQAEIYGEDITFEVPLSNIGYWHSADDHLRWQLRTDKPREFVLWAEWACHPDSAGNSFLIQGVKPELKGKVRSTGGWDRYQLQVIGTVVLAEGDCEIVMRPAHAPRGALADLRALHLVGDDGVPLAKGMVEQNSPSSTSPKTPEQIAGFILNEKIPQSLREAAVTQNLDKAANLLPLMVAGLPDAPGSAEEYRRIPWIWRVAIAVGKEGDAARIQQVLQASLPGPEQRLQHWQAVVIGGGLINGLSLSNRWPHIDLDAIISSHPDISSAWAAALQQAATMAEAENIPPGTRYDALRMIALLEWQQATPLLAKHLNADSHPELQMGAVSGLSDIPAPEAYTLLIASYQNLTDANQALAVMALTRSPQRCMDTLTAIAQGRLPEALKTDPTIQSLRQHPSEEVKTLAEKVLP